MARTGWLESLQAANRAQTYRQMIEAAPAAPPVLAQLAARVLDDPRGCSDALLLVADALRDCADQVPLPDRVQRPGFTDIERYDIRTLAAYVARHAPLRAHRCAA